MTNPPRGQASGTSPLARISRRIPRVRLRARVRHGRRRVEQAFLPVVQAALGAGLAYAIARYGLGHKTPFFAPIAAWVCLGFSSDRRVRKVAELAFGVALGVGLGDLIVTVIGSGAWQISLVLVIAALAARFLDRGLMLTMQAGVQAVVVVALPVHATGAPMHRWLDAVVGGLMALTVAALLPSDPRKGPRAQVSAVLRELGAVLNRLAKALHAGDIEATLTTLERARSMQPAVDEMHSILRGARETVWVSPAMRRYRGQVTELTKVAVVVDRAARNARVMCRRAIPLTEDNTHLPVLAEMIGEAADACAELRRCVAVGFPAPAARAQLIELARKLGPEAAELRGGSVITLVVLLRSLTVDLLQATGESFKSARGYLAITD